jgi:hypothetical protein
MSTGGVSRNPDAADVTTRSRCCDRADAPPAQRPAGAAAAGWAAECAAANLIMPFDDITDPDLRPQPSSLPPRVRCSADLGGGLPGSSDAPRPDPVYAAPQLGDEKSFLAAKVVTLR